MGFLSFMGLRGGEAVLHRRSNRPFQSLGIDEGVPFPRFFLPGIFRIKTMCSSISSSGAVHAGPQFFIVAISRVIASYRLQLVLEK
jgi:hypothetical protein